MISKKQIGINLFISLLFLAINYKVFLLTFTFSGELFGAVYQAVIFFIIFSLISYIFSFHKKTDIFIILFLLFVSLFSVYFENKMGITFDKQIIKNVMATNFKEVSELVSISFYLYVIFITIALGTLYGFLKKQKESIGLKAYLLIFSIHIVVFFSVAQIDNVLYKKIIKDDVANIVPIGPFKAISNYIRTKSREETIVKTDISKEFSYPKKHKKPLVAIFVIGESARGDRFSLNGYEKETNPMLSQEKNLLSYGDASSCDTSTQSSVPCLLGRATFENFSFPIKEVSFIQIFRKAGFETYWISMQSESNSIETFAKEAAYQIDMNENKYDMETLFEVQKIVKQATKETLIVLHTNGSHMDYNKKVPEEFQHFKPLCQGDFSECKKTTLDNSYDNTIYYTDLFLATLIESVKDKNSFLLYASDHGESLGEKYAGFIKRYGHASPYDVAPIEQTHIPVIAWFSDDFLEENNLSMKNFHKDEKISHDNVFNSMLGCAGFKSKNYLEEDLNICHK